MGNVIIVGAGISGLTLAWRLHQSGINVTVLEKNPYPGGTIRTVIDGDWLIESGPNSALETTPLFRQLFAGLAITDHIRYANGAADRRYILRRGRLHALPMSVGAFLRSSLWTVPGKVRLLKEPFVGRAAKEESIAEFVDRRLGREFLDYAINPFVAGVYAGNPEELSVQAAFPKLYALEEKYGGLVKGMIRGRKERRERAEQAKDRAKMFSFARGMAVFPEAVTRQLRDRVKLSSPVVGVLRGGDCSKDPAHSFIVTYESSGRRYALEADVVIMSLPSYAAGGLIDKSVSIDLQAVLAGIYYPPVVEVFLGYRREQVGIPLDGFGFLVPAVEKRRILGTIWSSVLFEDRAPASCVALTTFLGGARQPDLAQYQDKDVLTLVRSELADIMNITGPPVYTRISRWERAIPQYNLGYGKTIQAIEDCERQNPGLFFCSNYRGGIAVGDCVMSADRTAQEVLRFLKAKKTIQRPVNV